MQIRGAEAGFPIAGTNLLFGQFSPQNASKLRKLEREGGTRPKIYYSDPPLAHHLLKLTIKTKVSHR